jgi:hypothetical protein
MKENRQRAFYSIVLEYKIIVTYPSWNFPNTENKMKYKPFKQFFKLQNDSSH